MGLSDEYEDPWEFFKMFLILFHGRSEVERGFRINKQLLVENLKLKSSELDPETIKISNELIKSVKEAHCRYQDELEKQRKQQESQKPLKRKIVANEIKALKEKRVNLISEIEIDACRC